MDHRLIPDPLIGGHEWTLPPAPQTNVWRTFCVSPNSHERFSASFKPESPSIHTMAAIESAEVG